MPTKGIVLLVPKLLTEKGVLTEPEILERIKKRSRSRLPQTEWCASVRLQQPIAAGVGMQNDFKRGLLHPGHLVSRCADCEWVYYDRSGILSVSEEIGRDGRGSGAMHLGNCPADGAS